MILPYHLLKVCGGFVFAAQGSDIHSFSSALEHVSTWKYPVQQADESREAPAEAQESPAPEGPPAKRRKTEDGQKSVSNGQAADSPNGKPKSKKAAQYDCPANERPFVQGLYATTDGRHLIAITGSDKTIWVFEHDGAGNLKQLSQRCVYARPLLQIHH
jgi:tRNA (guanine-N(7)-)-methyltransferase subunit TRM82